VKTIFVRSGDHDGKPSKTLLRVSRRATPSAWRT
jgi:hypothetical protein